MKLLETLNTSFAEVDYSLSKIEDPLKRKTRTFFEEEKDFDDVRNDENQSYSAGWFFQYNRKLMITGEVTFTDNKSNVEELYEYDRFRFQAGFRYQF